MKKSSFLFLFLLFAIGAYFFQIETGIFQVRKVSAQQNYQSDAAAINSSANPAGSINSTTAQNVVPNYSTTAPQSSYYNNPAQMNPDSAAAMQSNTSGKVASSAFNNQGTYDLSYLPKSSATANIDVTSVTQLFTGAYSNCQPSTVTNNSLNTIQTCDQYTQVAQNSCNVNREITVTNTYTYSCTANLTYTTKTCTQNLNVVTTPGTLSAANFGNPVSRSGSYNASSNSIQLSLTQNGYKNYPASLGLVVGQQYYVAPLNSIMTVSSFSENRSLYCPTTLYTHPNCTSTLTSNVGFQGSGVGSNTSGVFTFESQISTPSPTITSSWQEVCP